MPHPSFPRIAFALCAIMLGVDASLAESRSAQLSLAGDWSIDVQTRVGFRTIHARLEIPPPESVSIRGEHHESLPLFNPDTAGWVKGAQLKGVRAQETTTPNLVDASSLVVRAGPSPDSDLFVVGLDYQVDPAWGTIGRLATGRIRERQPVYVSYRFTPLRLDTVILAAGRQILLRRGEPRAAAPSAPAISATDRRLANVWIPGPIPKLSDRNLFPILETTCPPSPARTTTVAERLLPNTIRRLRDGTPIRILAWGDSVTDGRYLPEPDRNRWQAQFVDRLRHRFPAARIELITEAWGGRNTGSYISEPPGSPHNYREKVLGTNPDLIVSEFVNDSGLSPTEVENRYHRFLEDFQGLGAEWIVLTPHYVRPDWMSLDRENDIDIDPRPYVGALRDFGLKHGVAVADAARRYGRLWRQGIPYTSLMLNSINHPNTEGMAIFADALMELFPKK